MKIAFANLSEPYAWLIRGLVEYGWQDITLLSKQVLPQETGVGFDLRSLMSGGGRHGFRLCLMAYDGNGEWYVNDQSSQRPCHYTRIF